MPLLQKVTCNKSPHRVAVGKTKIQNPAIIDERRDSSRQLARCKGETQELPCDRIYVQKRKDGGLPVERKKRRTGWQTLEVSSASLANPARDERGSWSLPSPRHLAASLRLVTSNSVTAAKVIALVTLKPLEDSIPAEIPTT